MLVMPHHDEQCPPVATLTTPGQGSPTAIAYLFPYLAIGEVDGTVQLIDLRKSSSTSRILTDSTSEILALALNHLTSNTVQIAFALQSRNAYYVKLSTKGRLSTIRTPHRSPPISLSFSPQSPMLASASGSELVLVDVTSNTCTWALRGPGPGPGPGISQQAAVLQQIHWTLSTTPQLLGLWSNGSICLWSLRDDDASPPVDLIWTAGPKEKWRGEGQAACDLSRDGAYFVTTFPTEAPDATCIMVWDVEDRSLAHKHTISLPSRLLELQVADCSATETVRDFFFSSIGLRLLSNFFSSTLFAVLACDHSRRHALYNSHRESNDGAHGCAHARFRLILTTILVHQTRWPGGV
ncbi:hypothetical protein P7C70_g3589, partial [Phenoliferia sp. Uapishka_3]